jgi:hypothetical protein
MRARALPVTSLTADFPFKLTSTVDLNTLTRRCANVAYSMDHLLKLGSAVIDSNGCAE